MMTVLGQADLQTTLGNVSLSVTILGSILLTILILFAIILARAKRPKLKVPLFVAIVVVVAGTTLTIAGSSIYLNVTSAIGGPAHWHADYEVWACGNEMNLRDPVGLSNKIGTPDLHEHNDKRIHLEGVPVTLPYDFSLAKFFDVVGGGINQNSLTMPLSPGNYFENAAGHEDGDGNGAPNQDQILPFIHTESDGPVATFVTGEKCGDQPATLQIFDYKYNAADNTYTQQKITDPATISMAHQENVPPGDCVIIEFGPVHDRTDKLCRSYGVIDSTRCGDFGVPPENRMGVCVAREVQ